MTTEERLVADFAGVGLTTGPHPMSYHRSTLLARGIRTAKELSTLRSQQDVRIAGYAIARQRPSTAKGFVFLSLWDETGIANIIITPDDFERNRDVATNCSPLLIEGPLQIQSGVIHVKARNIVPLDVTDLDIRSHNFH